MDALEEAPDPTRERALVALAAALILAASSRVAVPLLFFAAVVGMLALPMSGLIAWLSRYDAAPSDDDGGTFGGGDGDSEPWGEVVPFVGVPAEPLPRPLRPQHPSSARLNT